MNNMLVQIRKCCSRNPIHRIPLVLVLMILSAACTRPTPAAPLTTADSRPTPLTTATSMHRPPLMPHPLLNNMDCTACHNPRSTVPIPANHALYTGAECLRCHEAALPSTPGPTPTPQPMAHPIEGRETCSLCHAADRLELPADHRDDTDEKCTECHTGS